MPQYLRDRRPGHRARSRPPDQHHDVGREEQPRAGTGAVTDRALIGTTVNPAAARSDPGRTVTHDPKTGEDR
ncbi:MAG: hypothetical protein ABJA34_01615 [Pseudonocardiales bacterium]